MIDKAIRELQLYALELEYESMLRLDCWGVYYVQDVRLAP